MICPAKSLDELTKEMGDEGSCSFTIKPRCKRDAILEAEQLIKSVSPEGLLAHSQYLRSIALSLVVIAKNTNNMQ